MKINGLILLAFLVLSKERISFAQTESTTGLRSFNVGFSQGMRIDEDDLALISGVKYELQSRSLFSYAGSIGYVYDNPRARHDYTFDGISINQQGRVYLTKWGLYTGLTMNLAIEERLEDYQYIHWGSPSGYGTYGVLGTRVYLDRSWDASATIGIKPSLWKERLFFDFNLAIGTCRFITSYTNYQKFPYEAVWKETKTGLDYYFPVFSVNLGLSIKLF